MNKARSALICVGLAALATLPTEILAQWKGWDSMSLESTLAEVLWLPMLVYCQLALLVILGRTPGQDAKPSAAAALASAIGVELLIALRFCWVALLNLLPALCAFSLLGIEKPGSRILILVLALGGAVLPTLWLCRRLFAPTIVLWQGLNASQAIQESVRLSRGNMKRAVLPLLLWNGLAQGLEGLGLALPALNWVLLPLSLLIGQAALARAYAKLTL